MRDLSMLIYLIFMFATTLVAGIYEGVRKGLQTRKTITFRYGFNEGFIRGASICAIFEGLFFIYFWFTLWGKM